MLKQLPPILFIIATFLVNQVTLHSFKRYVGCYSDGSPNDLSALGLSSDPSLTQEKCWQKCRELQYLYAGLQGGNECWCGNQYGRLVSVSILRDLETNLKGNPTHLVARF